MLRMYTKTVCVVQKLGDPSPLLEPAHLRGALLILQEHSIFSFVDCSKRKQIMVEIDQQMRCQYQKYTLAVGADLSIS